MTQKKKYLFGPVPSRRLGYSLGVDIIPFKTCTQNCVYCQLGRDGVLTSERKEYVAIDAVLDEIKQTIEEGVHADFITISGSGEPTLNSRIGDLINGIKAMTDIPVAVITNGTLLWDEQVRSDISKADLVVPSLDAGDQKTFEKINKPCNDLSFEKLANGLIELRKEFKGQYWLEIFLIEGYNTTDEQIHSIREVVEQIKPDKIQLNTAVRPTAVSDVKMVSPERMQQIAEMIGNGAKVITDFSKASVEKEMKDVAEAILDTIKRRPCSVNDLSNGLGINHNEIIKHVTIMLEEKKIIAIERDNDTYYGVE